MQPLIPDDYKQIGKEMLEDFEKIDRDRLGEALLALNELVTSCFEDGEYSRIPRYCESACKLCDEIQRSGDLGSTIDLDYARGIFHTYEGVSYLFQYQGDRDLKRATNSFEEGQKFFHSEDYQWNEGIIWLNLGKLYRSRSEWERAFFAFQQSLHAFNRLRTERRQELESRVLAEIEKTHKLLRAVSKDQTNATDQHQAADSSKEEPPDREPSRWPVLQFLPIVSEIAAGKATYTSDDVTGYIATDVLRVGDQDLIVRMLRKGSELKFLPEYHYFATHVIGDSMVEADIAPDDYVILVKRPPRDRDVVAAVITDVDDGGGEATLKRFRFQENRITLKPESSNPEHQAYEFSLQEFQSRVRIAGVAVAVLKPKPS
jgi:SOS-response transcriptional repressor LexA